MSYINQHIYWFKVNLPFRFDRSILHGVYVAYLIMCLGLLKTEIDRFFLTITRFNIIKLFLCNN